MFKAFFESFKGKQSPHALYGAVVAQSRQSTFFRDMGVPDTMNGRFEMMCLHIYLILRRLKREGQEQAQFGQDLFDIFLDDMAAGLREAGVGDTTVPKRLQKMSRIFYGQAKAFEEVDLDGQPSATQKVEEILPILERNLYPDSSAPDSLAKLATYFVETHRLMAELPVSTIKSGEIIFPAIANNEAA